MTVAAIDEYDAFLASKAFMAPAMGFDPVLSMPKAMKPFQVDIVTWACRRGRAAIFAGTGLGKTLMELTWAANVAAKTGGQVLIFTPLAVAEQTVKEAKKFGINGVAYSADEGQIKTPITITNYDRRDKFDLSQFAGIVLDESGIIKDHDSRTRTDLTDACRETPYLLCGSATPAPNDWTELGQHSEFLGVMNAKEMLAMFFVHDGAVRANTDGDDWRLKSHAKADFWRWVASWAVMIRHPRDLGYDDAGYDLPPLNMHQITVRSEGKAPEGMLFAMEANTLQERIAVRKSSISDRVESAVMIIHEGWKCGSLSIAQPSAPNTEMTRNIGSVCDGAEGHQRKIASTCAPTTVTTRTNGSELRSKRPRATNDDGSGTTKTCSGASASPKSGESVTAPVVGSHLGNGQAASIRHTALSTENTSQCLSGRRESALSAVSPTETSTESGSVLTTATRQVVSGGCSALVATPPSGNSETILGGSDRLLRTSKKRWVVWCNLNSEQDAISAALGSACVSVHGSLSAEEKTARLYRWLDGYVPVLVTKPSIAGRGVNMQHDCCSMIFVGLNDSFEQLFQAVRRCWRFGQTQAVDCYLIASDLEGAVVANLQAKERKYEEMAAAMVSHMTDLTKANLVGGRRAVTVYNPTKEMKVPTWLQ